MDQPTKFATADELTQLRAKLRGRRHETDMPLPNASHANCVAWIKRGRPAVWRRVAQLDNVSVLYDSSRDVRAVFVDGKLKSCYISNSWMIDVGEETYYITGRPHSPQGILILKCDPTLWQIKE